MNAVYRLELTSCYDGTYGIGFFTTRTKAVKVGERLVEEEKDFKRNQITAKVFTDTDGDEPCYAIKRIPLDRILDVNKGYHGIL